MNNVQCHANWDLNCNIKAGVFNLEPQNKTKCQRANSWVSPAFIRQVYWISERTVLTTGCCGSFNCWGTDVAGKRPAHFMRYKSVATDTSHTVRLTVRGVPRAEQTLLAQTSLNKDTKLGGHSEFASFCSRTLQTPFLKVPLPSSLDITR